VRAAAATLRQLPRAARMLPRAALALPRPVRRIVAIALAASAAFLLGYLWLRDSPLVAVDRVEVSGLTTKDAPRIRAALEAAARDMTTLHVRKDELELAVSGYPVVASVEVDPDFPHGLRLRVVEHRPSALVLIRGGARVAVGADGTVLRGLPLDRSLPTLRAASPPRGARVTEPAVVNAVRVIAGAPRPLRRRIERVSQDRRGLVARLRRGPEVMFGSEARIEAKWVAAARVLADRAARGATYVDVRLPERPVAGGLGAQTIAPAGPPQAMRRPAPDAAAPAPLNPQP
jgi:cell division protein FtsQ